MLARLLFTSAVATSATALTHTTTPSMALSFGGKTFNLPGGRGKPSPKAAIPDEELPLTERLGGVGVSKPFPEGFDPFEFASRADAQQLIKFREAELKHSRVAMLAVPGFLLSEDFHPFFPALPKWEFGLFALQDTLEQPNALVAFAGAVLAIAAFEARSFKSWEVPEGVLGSETSTYFKMKSDIVPGKTLPAGPWTEDKLSPEEFRSKQTAELNNGRLAMISILLIVLQEITSKLPAAEFDLQTLNFIGDLLNTPGVLLGL